MHRVPSSVLWLKALIEPYKTYLSHPALNLDCHVIVFAAHCGSLGGINAVGRLGVLELSSINAYTTPVYSFTTTHKPALAIYT